MKKRFNLLAIIMFMMAIISTACTPDGNQEFPDNGPVASYEVKSDTQQPMSLFLIGIPEEYAAFKAPLASMVTMRESALKQGYLDKMGDENLLKGSYWTFRVITSIIWACPDDGSSA